MIKLYSYFKVCLMKTCNHNFYLFEESANRILFFCKFLLTAGKHVKNVTDGLAKVCTKDHIK